MDDLFIDGFEIARRHAEHLQELNRERRTKLQERSLSFLRDLYKQMVQDGHALIEWRCGVDNERRYRIVVHIGSSLLETKGLQMRYAESSISHSDWKELLQELQRSYDIADVPALGLCFIQPIFH